VRAVASVMLMRAATARTCPVISSPARCRSRCMPDSASSPRNTSILLSSHVRLGTWQVFHPPATEPGLTSQRPVAVRRRLRRRSPQEGCRARTTGRARIRARPLSLTDPAAHPKMTQQRKVVPRSWQRPGPMILANDTPHRPQYRRSPRPPRSPHDHAVPAQPPPARAISPATAQVSPTRITQYARRQPHASRRLRPYISACRVHVEVAVRYRHGGWATATVFPPGGLAAKRG